MKAALFVPCYVDAVFPEVAIATLELLERLGFEVAYPMNQTCCGQPMANTAPTWKLKTKCMQPKHCGTACRFR